MGAIGHDGLGVPGKVELAHEAQFHLGNLEVQPATRQVNAANRSETLEPRVMQVLVALYRAGGIVTRDELIERCWDGRIVTDDAINRVLSRLRKVAGDIGADSIEIETVTRVGYRLVHNRDADEFNVVPPSQNRGQRFQPSRRAVLTGAAAVGALGAGGGVLLYRRAKHPAVPPEVQMLMTQAEITREQPSLDAANETIAIYQRVLQMAPGYADAWGKMGFSYAIYSHFRERQTGEAMRSRAEAAGKRALELDPGNPYGELALSVALPFVGHWLEKERRLRRAFANQPDNDDVLFAFGYLMMLVGRVGEATHYYERIKRRPFAPVAYADYISALWSAGRMEEADRAMADAGSLYPTHAMVWGTRFDILLFSGRATAAAAMVGDWRARPQRLSESDATRMTILAQAIESRIPAEVDAAMDANLQGAKENPWAAEEAIMTASALGRIDQAFTIADAYYFSRGFTVPDGQLPPNQRSTDLLFRPVTQPLRTDPRYNRLVDELGLEHYWRESGSQPDYRRA